MRKIFTLVFILVLAADLAIASYISLKTTLASEVEGASLTLAITAANKGDESAYNVQAEVAVAGQNILLSKTSELGREETYQETRKIRLDILTPGHYPLVLTMHYADANQYPFSALTAQTFAYQALALPALIFGQLKGDTFWRQGKISLVLKNMGDTDIKARAVIVAPRELTALTGSSELVVPAKGETGAVFGVKNFAALSGSTYQVFAVTEYEQAGQHQAVITPGTLKIVETRQILGINYNIIFAILAALLLIFVAAQIIKK